MVTAYLSQLGQLEIGGETEFANAATNFVYVRSMPCDPSTLTKAALVNEHMRTEDYEVAKIMGRANGTFVSTHHLHGYSSNEPSAAETRTGAANGAATAWSMLMDALASALGGIAVGGYSGSESVGATGSPTDTLTATDVSTFLEGMPVAWKTGQTDKPREIGWSVDSDPAAGPPETISLLQTPDDDPQGDTLWGGYCIYRKTDSVFHTSGSFTDAPSSFSLKYTAHDGTVYTMLGCRPSSVKVTLTAGELPMLEITWSVADWSAASGGSLSVNAWSYPEPEAVSQWLVRWGNNGSVYDLTCKSVELTIDVGLQEVGGGYANSAIEDWFTAHRTVTCAVTAYRSFANDYTAFVNQTANPLQVQIGSAAGRMFGFVMPQATLGERPPEADESGAMVSNLVFVPTYYSGDTGSASDTTPIDTDVRLAFV